MEAYVNVLDSSDFAESNLMAWLDLGGLRFTGGTTLTFENRPR